jgi:serine/threonine protein kinase
MPELASCPKCGMKLAPNAPRGLCPGCLFRGALEAHSQKTGVWHPADRFRESPPAPEELAADFPDLEILHFVGRGGMGMVYKARQKQLNRIVALKILAPGIARDAAFAERFLREAQVMALLTHQHIVTVYDFGKTPPSETGDRDVPLYYFLMEFVDGLTLRQLLDAGQLTPTQAFAIVPQICEALQYAHDKGVVHRDIKPENILMDRQGNVKIADFGLAKLMGLQSHDLTLSTTGQVLGTLHYMAPEQMERPTEVDHRADIYSLGVVFYQMLTGELPLGHFAPPSRKALVDARLDEVVLRALEKEPARRYQQASALQTQVESIAATPAAATDEAEESGRRRSWLSAVTGMSLVAQLAVAFVLTCVVAGCLGVFGWLRSSASSGRTVSLAEMPQELRRVSTARVIDAGIEKPLLPWAWQELERRGITRDEADQIVERLTGWLRREHPQGMSEPLHSLDRFIRQLDERGLVTEQRKIAFLEALEGELRGDRSFRLRESAISLSLHVEWRRVWDRDLFGMSLMNELQSMTLDGEPVREPMPGRGGIPGHWGDNYLAQSFPLPPLKPGKHALRLSVLSALVASADLTGLKFDARSADWPPARKRWTRILDIEVTVFPAEGEIISATHDPSLNPVAHGLSIEPIIIRGSESRSATLKFEFGSSLPVPIGFDVSLRLAGTSVPCGSIWAVHTSKRSAHGNSVLTAALPPIGADVQEADVVLTPNPQLIELKPNVDRYWGDEVVFRKVSLRRLDAPSSGDVEAQ